MDASATTVMRLADGTLALGYFAVAMTILIAVLSLFGVTDRNLYFVARASSLTGFAACVVGWKWPYTVLRPIGWAVTFVPSLLASKLTTPIQRGFFAFGVLALPPWLIGRVLAEIGHSGSVKEYFRSVFYPLASTVANLGYWDRYDPEWYDWFAALAILAFLLAFAWPYTGARLIGWIRGQTAIK
jgi:hypothetical protein